MKRVLILLAGFLLSLSYSSAVYAQNTSLVPDQNPNHEISRSKYLQLADSLTRTQGTTVQNTYKAYDWYTAREERRALRRERNHLERLYSPSYYPNSYFSFGYSNYYSPWGFNYNWNWNRHRYNRW